MSAPVQARPKCAWAGCDKPARAKGFCDTHYRHLLRRAHGVGGIEPMDETVYKLRIRVAGRGTQPIYYSNPEAAYARADIERKRGTLLFFGRYDFAKEE
jgi:hypothetical protein